MFHNKFILITLFVAVSCTLISAQSSSTNVAAETSKIVADKLPSVVEDNQEDPEKKKTTTTTTTTPSVPETTTKDSKTTPTTTVTTASSTTSSSTTTTPPPTSTQSTTTTSTTTTTAAPNTTTVGPITTTPAPAPYPKPSIGTWNSSCILVKMAAQLNLTYITKDNKNATVLYNIPTDAVVHDTVCNSETMQSIDINWGPNTSVNMMLLQFDKRNQSVDLSKLQFTINIDGDRFPNAKENQTVQLIHFGWAFKTPVQMSYHCTRTQTFNLTETIDNKTIIGTVYISDVQAEAFRTKNSTGFSTVHDCDASGTSDIVPIAVGIALVALILIVLISYLCARRRSTSRGYMSF